MKKQPNRRQPAVVLDEQRLTAAAGGYDLDIIYCGTPPWGPRGPGVLVPIEIGPIRVGP
jgi:hypothetical protein